MPGRKSTRKPNKKMEALDLVQSFGTQASHNRFRSLLKPDRLLAHQSSKLAHRVVTEWATIGQTQLRNATTHHLISKATKLVILNSNLCVNLSPNLSHRDPKKRSSKAAVQLNLTQETPSKVGIDRRSSHLTLLTQSDQVK